MIKSWKNNLNCTKPQKKMMKYTTAQINQYLSSTHCSNQPIVSILLHKTAKTNHKQTCYIRFRPYIQNWNSTRLLQPQSNHSFSQHFTMHENTFPTPTSNHNGQFFLPNHVLQQHIKGTFLPDNPLLHHQIVTYKTLETELSKHTCILFSLFHGYQTVFNQLSIYKT